MQTREQLITKRDELETWLTEHPGHENQLEVRKNIELINEKLNQHPEDND